MFERETVVAAMTQDIEFREGLRIELRLDAKGCDAGGMGLPSGGRKKERHSHGSVD